MFNTEGYTLGQSRFSSWKKITLLTLLILIYANAFSQNNINTTLGTGGIFTIKDLSNNYFTLSQSTGQVNILNTLRLENTSNSTTGIIFKGADRFIHNYGTQNTFMGINSGNFTMTGYQNTAVGYQSLNANTLGIWNTAVGYQSLNANTTGSGNTAVGLNSLVSNTTGFLNTAVGLSSLYSNTTGYQNTAVGYQSLYSNTTGGNNTAVGLSSLYSNTTGLNNTAVGLSSLYTNTTGTFNTALGFQSLYWNTTGYQNTAVGFGSLYTNTTGLDNTALGYQSLNFNTGNQNTALGSRSLYTNTTGGFNTAVGLYSLTNNTTGSNNTGIGNDAQVPNGTLNNQVRIGNILVTYAGVQVAWTITSDKRWKSDIQDSKLSLSFINKLRPVSYFRNNDESKKTEYGFIAQEVEQVLKEEGVENTGMITITDEGMYELRYNDLLAPMVKAIQELKSENDVLKNENNSMKVEISSVKSKNDKLESEVESLKSMSEKLVKLERLVNELTTVKNVSLSELK